MIVLDASALVDVVLALPSAGWVLDQLEADDVCTPGHQPAEVLSALARLSRAGAVSADEAAKALSDAAELRQELVPLDRGLLWRALELRDRVRPVDGLYVALAERRGISLVTTDLRLSRSALPCAVRTPVS